MIIRAFAAIQKQTGSKLMMARPENKTYYEYIDQGGIADHVEFYDPRPYHEMPELYNKADCGISMPDWDSSSTAMLECMACGTPVIASAIPQNNEWIRDRRDGMLAQLNDRNLMLKMWQIRHTPPEERWRMGTRGRIKVVTDGDFDREMHKALSYYEWLMSKKS